MSEKLAEEKVETTEEEKDVERYAEIGSSSSSSGVRERPEEEEEERPVSKRRRQTEDSAMESSALY